MKRHTRQNSRLATTLALIVLLIFSTRAMADNRAVINLDTALAPTDVAQTGPSLVVNALADPGSDGVCGKNECTLREAIAAAESNPDETAITFSVSGTITASGGAFYVSTPITITSPAGGITISGTGFNILNGFGGPPGILTLNGLTITRSPVRAITNDGIAHLNGINVVANSSNNGGGIGNFGIMTVANSIISNNTATDSGSSQGYGGGILSAGTLTMTQSTISDNTAKQDGGGIYIIPGGALVLHESTISGNMAVSGGGIYNQGPATIVQSTVSGNTDGVYNAGQLLLQHSTIAANTDDGITNSNTGVVTATHTILVRNGAQDFSASQPASVISQGYNLVGTGGQNMFTHPGDQVNIANPNLGPLQDNGGPTRTHLPLPGSPAINAGDPNFVQPPAVDQRGHPRVQAGRIDIGAVETTPLIVTISNASVVEGGDAMFTVTLDMTSTLPITISYATIDGTAIAGTDYVATNGTLNVAPGQTTAVITVTTLNDMSDGPNKTFTVALNSTEPSVDANQTATALIIEKGILTAIDTRTYLPMIMRSNG